MDEKIIELINRGIDGELGEKESEALRDLLARDPEARRLHDRFVRLHEMLGGLDGPEVPASLKQGVISSVEERARQRQAREARQEKEGRWVHSKEVRTVSSSRKSGGRFILWGLGVVAVAGIVYVTMNDNARTEDGAEAAIGAAERYQVDQIQTEDVVVNNPELQSWMQTDEFDKLVHDGDFAAALNSAAFAKAFGSADLRNALAAAEVRSAIGSAEAQAALGSAKFQALLEAASFREALGVASVREALGAAEMRNALGSAKFQAFLESAKFQEALGSGVPVLIQKALDSAAQEGMLGSDQVSLLYSAVVESASLRTALGAADVRNALAAADVRTALGSKAVARMMESADMRNALAAADVRNALAAAPMARILGAATFQNALGAASFRNALGAASFRNALASDIIARRGEAVVD